MKIDGCRIRQQSLGPFSNLIHKPLMKSSNFEFKCPFKARAYNITNFKPNLESYFAIPNLGNYCLETEIYGKPKQKKSVEKMISFGGTGRFKTI
jgi:hypothetical protein